MYLYGQIDIMKTRLYVIAGLLLLTAAGCRKTVDYPIEPQISYEGFKYVTDENGNYTGQGVLTFSYIDGDGDLGLDDSDTLSPFGFGEQYYYNLIIEYRKYQNGAFVATPIVIWNASTQSYDTTTFSARFKRLLDSEDDKPITGTMDYTMDILNPLSQGDTVKFAVKIIDRALHESNTIETDVILTNPDLKR